jgi:hypothetical protein
VRIAEAADAAQAPEVVIERAVLLHQDDDVRDVLDAAGARRGVRRGVGRRIRRGLRVDRQRALDAARQRAEGGGAARQLQEPATADR